eukprot:6356800-Lingulodinium_polyedra.AAC.1
MKHAPLLAEFHKVPRSTVEYGAQVSRLLPDLLAGRSRCPLAPARDQPRLRPRGALCAGPFGA